LKLETGNLKARDTMKEVYELDVYRLAEELSDLIWFAYDTWDGKAQHTIGQQVIRSVDSIDANIAEGFGRYSPADRKKFYLYACGSFEETKCWLRKAFRRKVISPAEVKKLQAADRRAWAQAERICQGDAHNLSILSASHTFPVSSFEFSVSSHTMRKESEYANPDSGHGMPEVQDADGQRGGGGQGCGD